MTQIDASAISDALKRQLENFKPEVDVREVGTVIILPGEEQVLATGAGGQDVDRGERTPRRDLAVEPQHAVGRAGELLEDDLVGRRAGVHKRGGDDGQGPPLFDITGSAEKAFGLVQCI